MTMANITAAADDDDDAGSATLAIQNPGSVPCQA